MSIKNLKSSVQRLQDILLGAMYYKDRDKNRIKIRNYESQAKTNIKFIEENFWKTIKDFKDNKQRLEFAILLGKVKDAKEVKEVVDLTARMQEVLGCISNKEGIKFIVPNISKDVKTEVEADITELKDCYINGCYRSAVILCGRLLEVALHRKYYDVTGRDILEKSPGIGLGNLIRKLTEKEVKLDPGLSQQVHLINNVRIFSVHKKQEVFRPTKAQTEAIILFTLDSLEKLF
jgi:hypothetical protein